MIWGMTSNIEAERAIKRLPHVLSANAPFLSTTMRVAVDFTASNGELLRAFGDRAGPIAGKAGYQISISFVEPALP
jgi:hypothetical protein